METDDFVLMCHGFFEKRKADEIRFAKVAFYVNAIGENLAGKPAHGEKFIMEWLGEKPKRMTQEDLKARSEDIQKRLKFIQQLEDEKDKIKRGRKLKTNN